MRSIRVLTSLAAGLLSGVAALAGDLDPPPGPIGPTMKPLDQLEPRIAINDLNTPGDGDSVYRISQPGSYYLTGPVVGVAGKSGIEIAASGVSVDLCGFELAGIPGSAFGIHVPAPVSRILLRNGFVKGWGQTGAFMFNASESTVEDVRASDNGLIGIQVGDNCVIRRCLATNNASDGMRTQNDGAVIACVSSFNQFGINVSGAGLVADCTTNSNSVDGIRVSFLGAVARCTSANNGAFGIISGAASRIHMCLAAGNGTDGVRVDVGSSVLHCTSSFNTGDGVVAVDGCEVAHCIVRENSGDGIEVTTDSRVTNNTCHLNGQAEADGAGIHATGSDNRIEGNNVTDNDRGIDVDTGGNVIIRNSASGNTTNFAISGANFTGTIVATEAAMNGSANANINLSF